MGSSLQAEVAQPIESYNQIQIQQGALATEQTIADAAILTSLQNLVKSPTFDVPYALDLLNRLSAFYPTLQKKMGALYQADPEAVAADPQQKTLLQQITSELVQDVAQQQQLKQDLTVLKDDAQKEAHTSKKEYSRALQASLDNVRKNKISPQMQSVLDETAHAVDKAHSAKRDKGMFDPLGVLGHLFELLLQKGFIVPLDEQMYARGFKFAAPNDEYVDHLRQQHGNTTVFPADNAPMLR